MFSLCQITLGFYLLQLMPKKRFLFTPVHVEAVLSMKNLLKVREEGFHKAETTLRIAMNKNKKKCLTSHQNFRRLKVGGGNENLSERQYIKR